MFKRSSRRGRLSAFTLLEMLVVLTIIGILLAIILPNYSRTQTGAMNTAAKAEMNGYFIAMMEYKKENGNIPASPDDLVKSGLIKKDMAMDPWNHSYKIEYDPATQLAKVISAGADGQFGSKDDIVIEENI